MNETMAEPMYQNELKRANDEYEQAVNSARKEALRESADVAIDYGKQQYIANVVNQPRYADNIADDAQEIAGQILALIGKKNPGG